MNATVQTPLVDLSEADTLDCSVDSARAVELPIAGVATCSLRGDGFIVALVGDPADHAILSIGSSGQLAHHVGADARALRAFAAQAVKAADLLDQGKGKQ